MFDKISLHWSAVLYALLFLLQLIIHKLISYVRMSSNPDPQSNNNGQIINNSNNNAKKKTYLSFVSQFIKPTLRSRMPSSPNSPSNNNNDKLSFSNSIDSTSPKNVNVDELIKDGLQNLDNARTMASRAGNDQTRKNALEMYQSTIEFLLQIMQHHKIDKQELTERISNALSEAEQLKSSLSPQKPITKPVVSPSSRSNITRISSHKKPIIKPVVSPTSHSNSTSISSYKRPTISPNSKNTLTHPNRKYPQRKKAISPSNATFNKQYNSQKQNQSQNSTQTTEQSKKTLSRHLKNPLYPLISNSMYIPSNALPKTPLSSLSGLTRQKQVIHQSIVQPLTYPNLYTGLRSPPSGILLYGPPGTGKTMLVKAIAYETREQTMFFSCSSSTLSSKWHGEGEKIVSLLFQVAREAAPSIVFLDEMDALLGKRGGGGGDGGGTSGGGRESEVSRRFKTEFMVQMDGMMSQNKLNKRIWVFGCTNTPWDIDEAILRRMEIRLYVPLPDKEARQTLLQQLLEQNSHSLTNRQFQFLVDHSGGFSCSDLRSFCREAAYGPLRDLDMKDTNASLNVMNENDLRPISYKDFLDASRICSKSVSEAMIKKFKKWENENSGIA